MLIVRSSSSEFDWTLEIIQDSERKDVPQILREFIAASLNNISTEHTDPLGLRYPAIALRNPIEFKVQSVVMRSVFQYQWTNSANIVEIAIYREWPGCDTRRAPAMQASVSMFNPDWEAHMDSIENTSLDRKWDPEMHNFFGKEGVGHRITGLRGLIAEIREIQQLLSVATEELKAKVAEEEREQEEKDYLKSQMRQVQEDEAEERRQKEITKKPIVEKKAVNKPATTVPPFLSKLSFIGTFDDNPAQDGSLI